MIDSRQVSHSQQTSNKSSKETIKHYRKPVELPFTKPQVANTKILIGGLSNGTDRLMAASLRGIGYHAYPLPVPDSRGMELGKEFCDAGLCNPTYFTIGNLIQYLDNVHQEGMSKEEICEKYVFVTAGSCGPCRFGMYEYEYRMALKNAGYPEFRILIFQSAGSLVQGDQEAGLTMNYDFFSSLIYGVIFADHLNELRYLIKPYEVVKGESDRVIEECVTILEEAMSRRQTPNRQYEGFAQGFLNSEFGFQIRYLNYLFRNKPEKEALEKCRRLISQIEVDHTRVKPLVKITGEFWAQLTEGDGNYRMFDFLHEEGCEIFVEGVTAWLIYVLWLEKTKYAFEVGKDEDKRRNGFFKRVGTRIRKGLNIRLYELGNILLRYKYNQTGKRLGGLTQKVLDVPRLSSLARPYMDIRYDGGEGFLEVAKNIYYNEERKAHMVLSLKPFGCMPSTISDSVQSRVVSDHDDMIFLPLETSGEGKINALSRVQMALGETRIKAAYEKKRLFEEAGFSHDDLTHGLHQKNYRQYALDRIPMVEGYALRAAHLTHYAVKRWGKRTFLRKKETFQGAQPK